VAVTLSTDSVVVAASGSVIVVITDALDKVAIAKEDSAVMNVKPEGTTRVVDGEGSLVVLSALVVSLVVVPVGKEMVIDVGDVGTEVGPVG